MTKHLVFAALAFCGLLAAGHAEAQTINCQVYSAQPASTFFAVGATPVLPCDRTGAPWVNAPSASGGTSSNFGSAFPTAGTAVGFKDSSGVNMQPGSLDAAGYINFDLQAINANVTVVGNVASGGTDSGNPVSVAGVFHSATPTFTDGQRAELQVGSRGSLAITLFGNNSSTATPSIAASADALSAATIGVTGTGLNEVYNGTTWDRLREAVNGASTTGTGVAAVAPLDQFDDVAPTSCTENQFCNVRQSANRDQYETIRDAAGNERGANVNSSNQLSVSVDGGSALGGIGTTGAAVPATAVYSGFNTGGNLTGAIRCQSSVPYDASTSGSTQLVALSSGKVIYICGFNILAGGTVNVKLVYGTGTNCASGAGNITPAYQLTAQAGMVDDPAVYQGLNAIASNELCINASGAVAVQAIVYYTQF